MGINESVASAVSDFGKAAKAKLTALSMSGQPEDQLRGPIEQLWAALCSATDRKVDHLTLVGETSLAELSVRPDYAVEYAGTLIGFIEVKAPGKGADPRLFRDPHDRTQWTKLQALPNLIYFDGQEMSLWQSGQLVGSIAKFGGGIVEAGEKLAPPPNLLQLWEAFFSWRPIAPRTPHALATMSAQLCRLLRDEAAEQLALENAELVGLMNDWKGLLFPEATPAQFADWYAQSVTFGLLLARARGIDLTQGVAAAARELSASTQTLIGSALRALVDTSASRDALQTSVATMGRVLAVVDWARISKNDPDAWLYFYEGFLQTYDKKLRKKTGSYYTPVEVVRAMAGLVDEALVSHLGLPAGVGDDTVTIVDPAMGTGTFLLEILRRIAETVTADQGVGAVGPALEEALRRLIGFEIQLGPFAVAQLRLLAELHEYGAASVDPSLLRTYVTNTLEDPFVEEKSLGSWYQPITEARRAANKAKAEEEILVVIGNPPYKDKSRGKGAWIESGSDQYDVPPLEDFFPPKEWGVGTHTKHLYNLYVYFWRWAMWKVFDRHKLADKGVICFITVAGMLHGPGFQGMRRSMREKADDIWVINCSPEGFTPPVNTRVFEAMKHEVCIVLAVKNGRTSSEKPATVRYRELAPGHRTDKFLELEGVRLADGGWADCSSDWRAPFLPAGGDEWLAYPSLSDIFRYNGSGTMPGRTWVIDPDSATLKKRWKALITEKDLATKRLLMQEHSSDRRIDTVPKDNLPGFPPINRSLNDETADCPEPIQIAFRSLDRQRMIPDKRVINRPNPSLWSARSDKQAWLTAPGSETPLNGPALTASGLVPDLDHYRGRGGRVFPLWLDKEATVSNVVPGLAAMLGAKFGDPVSDEDLFAYVAGLTSHDAYTTTFAQDLETPGLRVPLTASAELFKAVSAAGRQVVWLHSYGTRFVDASEGRPSGAPRLQASTRPAVPAGKTIPTTPDAMPETIGYDADAGELTVGAGRISNVTSEMWAYEISGNQVIKQWFSSRQKNREKVVIGDRVVSPLLKIHGDRWTAEYTSQLIDLLNVIGMLVELEVEQASLLKRVLDAPTISVDDLTAAGVLPVPARDRVPKNVLAAADSAAGRLFTL
ncbi:N-6 DNA methylase [Paenarthrobacter sp. PAE-2]|uniref:type ISP restriction/modification enzyme n=1 Tax=Paenarthrobacter sp. PAE-2 TaxID=2982532 RepID=UPI00222EF601|nr:type ISP restriction/modification enzyme [Paenarthrobacter sp. PAE-2]MCW3765055.1 N-6 DNA methylase [Paenarthrobacter sp. PAE-2]